MPTAQATAVAAQADVNAEPVNHNPSNDNTVSPQGAVSSQELQLDEFGRDASERTVELSPRDAEGIDQEVTQGKWQTYDDALSYVIGRGMAEIKRQRDAARALAEKSLVKAKRDSYATLMKANPSLVASPEFVATMLR